MPKVIRATPQGRFVPEHCHILCGGDYMVPFARDPLVCRFLHLDPIEANPWSALEVLEIDHAEFKDEVRYVCPYTGYTFFWAVPQAILAEDTEKYKVGRYAGKSTRDWLCGAWDNDWMRRMHRPEVLFEPSRIALSLLGTGYTHGTMIHDGHAELSFLGVPLDNGDQLLCHVWKWFNK